MSFQPLLASAVKDIADVRLPVLASPKLDGIRVLIGPDGPVTRKLKAVPNKKLFAYLNQQRFFGLDGEVIFGNPTAKDVMQATTSAVMSHDGPDPEEGGFTFHVFDRFDMPAEPYYKRLQYCVSQTADDRVVRLLHHSIVVTLPELAELEEEVVSKGYEGLMIRDPNGRYKFGRSTVKEGILLKIKRFADDEAELVGMVELNRNLNEATTDERGYTKRSTSKEGKVAAGVMGALVLRSSKWADTFEIGSGFTAEQRADFWVRRDDLLGELVTFKHQPSGAKDKPRFPVFKGFRHVNDL